MRKQLREAANIMEEAMIKMEQLATKWCLLLISWFSDNGPKIREFFS